jgi:hypothetical protein
MTKGRGYPTSTGYRGWVDGRYMEFETDDAYLDYLKEREEEDPED